MFGVPRAPRDLSTRFEVVQHVHLAILLRHVLHRLDEFPRLQRLKNLRYLRHRQIRSLFQLFRPHPRVSGVLNDLIHQHVLRAQSFKLGRLLLSHAREHQRIPPPKDVNLSLIQQFIDRLRALLHRHPSLEHLLQIRLAHAVPAVAVAVAVAVASSPLRLFRLLLDGRPRLGVSSSPFPTTARGHPGQGITTVPIARARAPSPRRARPGNAS